MRAEAVRVVVASERGLSPAKKLASSGAGVSGSSLFMMHKFLSWTESSARLEATVLFHFGVAGMTSDQISHLRRVRRGASRMLAKELEADDS